MVRTPPRWWNVFLERGLGGEKMGLGGELEEGSQAEDGTSGDYPPLETASV